MSEDQLDFVDVTDFGLFYIVDWADLTCIDLAKARTPEGRAEQVRLARDATHKKGFFYVINHGLDKKIVGYTRLSLCAASLILFSQVDRMVDIAALAFDDVSEEEKLRYQARIKETGEYLGYKLPQYWVCDIPLNYTTLQ